MSNVETPPPVEEKPVPAAQPPRAKSRTPSVDRPAIAITVLVQVVLVLLIIGMLNLVSFNHFLRWDFSRNKTYALSSQTKNVLKRLGDRNERVQAIVFFPTQPGLTNDVLNLLREYEFASDRHLSLESVTLRNLARARQLAEQYKFGGNDNIIILDYKGKTKFVNATDTVDLDSQTQAVRYFKGEEAVTSALIELTDEKQNKLYMVQGHGETDVDTEMASEFKNYLGRQNIKIEKINLSNVDAVPQEATGVLLFGPQNDLTEREVKLLSDYWRERKGRIIALLNPQAKTARLDAFLTGEGVTPQHDRVLRTRMFQKAGTNEIVNGIDMNPGGTFLPSGKAISRDLAAQDVQFLGATQSFAIDLSKAQKEGNRITNLVESMDGYWGETDLAGGSQVFFDANADHAGPLTLAVAVEKGGIEDARVKVETARMVLVGNFGFATDQGVQLSQIGLDFAMNAINWAFNRELISGIPPKPKEAVKLSLSDEKLNTLAATVMLYIPALIGALGVLVWGVRSERLWLAVLILFLFTVAIASLKLLVLWFSHLQGPTA